MEVSVIGNSQANIYRAGFSCRELRCHGFEASYRQSRNRVSFGGQSTRCKELYCSTRVVRCEAVVSNETPIQKSSQRSGSRENVRLFVGLPLDTVSECNSVTHAKAIAVGLRALKLLGVEGVELPIFWGVVQREAAGKYDWSGYLAVMELIQKAGLKVQVSLCFHGSDQPKIPLPSWVTRIGDTESSLYFTDKSGRQYKDCLSFAVDDLPVLDGKTPIKVYRGFCENFKSAFSDFMGNTITGITIGLGPEGELRYPSHHHSPNHGAGEFQCYDNHMLASLKQHAEATGNHLWGLGGPHDAPAYDQQPHSSTFFKDGGSWESPYGDFFLSWYSSLLVSHADRVLSLASSTFSGTGTSLSGKLPLMYTWHKLRSRPSELTAGLYSTGDRDAYEVIGEMFAKSSCRMIIPGMDLSDELQPSESLSSPESLLAQIKLSCKKLGVVVAGQNSSVGGFKRIIENLTDENTAIDLFTYQRMGAYFFSPEHFPSFTQFTRSLHRFELPPDDTPANSEETASIGSTIGTVAMRAA